MPPIEIAALLTRMSSRPPFSSAVSMRLRMSASTATSQCTYSAARPFALSSPTNASPFWSAMSLANTCAPSTAMASAMAWPMPSAAPVTTAILPCRRPMRNPPSDAPALELVEGDGGDDDAAGYDELPLGRQGQHAQAVGQERQDQHAERHAEQAADAAGQADAAEHDCGHDLELEAEAGDVDGRAEAGGQHDAGDRRKQRTDDKAGELHTLHV